MISTQSVKRGNQVLTQGGPDDRSCVSVGQRAETQHEEYSDNMSIELLSSEDALLSVMVMHRAVLDASGNGIGGMVS